MTSKTRVLIIGVGSIGERHTRCFQRTDRAEVSICEINEALRDDVASRYRLAAAYTDWQEALASDYQAAVICTPAHLHVSMAIDIANCKRHLLIEKPLSTAPSIRGARLLTNFCATGRKRASEATRLERIGAPTAVSAPIADSFGAETYHFPMTI